MKSRLLVIATMILTACTSLTQPNFYRMSESEIAAYNEAVAAWDQVTCISIQIESGQVSRKLCGTMEEIDNSLKPVVPDERQKPATRSPFIDKGRSTNPPLTPANNRVSPGDLSHIF